MTQRRIIITGGGTGMGHAIAQDFAAAGERIVILGRRAQVLEQAARELSAQFPNAAIDWRRCDISRVEDVEVFADWLVQSANPTVDVLVNNAGGVLITPRNATFAQQMAIAQQELAINLTGPYMLTRALLPQMRRPGGRIITISSIAAVRGGGDIYSAAKAGLIGLTYSLAGELAAEGITANAVAPGFIADTEFFGERMTPERHQRTVSQIPVGRPGTPAEIAAAVRYLASDEASYVTGQVLHVNGGWSFGR